MPGIASALLEGFAVPIAPGARWEARITFRKARAGYSGGASGGSCRWDADKLRRPGQLQSLRIVFRKLIRRQAFATVFHRSVSPNREQDFTSGADYRSTCRIRKEYNPVSAFYMASTAVAHGHS